MSHVEPEHNRQPEGTEPDEPFPMIQGRKIGRLANGEPGYVVTESLPATDDDNMRPAPRSEQEWTVYEKDGQWFLLMVDVGIPMTDELSTRSVMTTHKAALAAEWEKREAMAIQLAQTLQQLLSAQEAIAEHNQDRHTATWCYEIDVDPSLLEQHDKQVRFEVWNKAAQKIERLRDILKACEPFAKAWAAEDLLDRIRDELKQ